MRDATEIERRGTPAVAVITRPFQVTADSMAMRQGYPGYRYVLVEHPVASLDDAGIRGRAKAALPEILAILERGGDGEDGRAPLAAPRSATGTRVDAAQLEHVDALAAIDEYFERGWTDGLPIVPPTPGRVAELLAEVGRHPDEVLVRMAPIRRSCTVRQAAINAVMAGCPAACFRAVVAALDAAADPGWKHPYWYILNASTSGQAPFYVINGPARAALGINCGVHVFGPGTRSNMTIGRAIRLILLNVFDVRPGVLDMSVQGQPGKLSLCIGENEEESPWPPFHVDRGFAAADSTLTYMSARGTHPVENRASLEPEKILQTIVDLMTSLALLSTPTTQRRKVIVMGPEHAHLIAAAGWSKTDVKGFVHERARRRRAEYEAVTRVGSAAAGRHAGWDAIAPIPERMVRSVGGIDYIYEHDSPDDVLLVVAGAADGGTSAIVPLGLGRYAMYGAPIPCAGVVTTPIELGPPRRRRPAVR